jgi:hypothetical protein
LSFVMFHILQNKVLNNSHHHHFHHSLHQDEHNHFMTTYYCYESQNLVNFLHIHSQINILPCHQAEQITASC